MVKVVSEPVLRVEHLTKHYQLTGTLLGRLLSRGGTLVKAVDGVSFELKEGEVFGLVGESGCGKTTLGRSILRLTEPTSGRVIFDGQDITHIPDSELRPLRRRMQIVFQDPHASLNPAMTVGRAVGHPLQIHGLVQSEEEAKHEVLRVLREVGLEPAEEIYERYPTDLSGGQKQRVVIARAMILNPSFVVADEAVAMLDMSVRARILELLMELKERYGLTYLFITHDLATAKFVCNRIAIMYLGKIVEMGLAKEIYDDPWHPYTKALLKAIPVPDPSKRGMRIVATGEVPDAVAPPQGCRFHPRCPDAFYACGWEPKDLLDSLEIRGLPPDVSEIIGPPETMSISKNKLLIPTKGGVTERIMQEVAAWLKRERAISEAVEEVRVEGRDVAVVFRKPIDPRDIDIEGRLVKCHLFDHDVSNEPVKSTPSFPRVE